MTTISITELPALVGKFSQADGSAKPLGVITINNDTMSAVRRCLEEVSGSRRINDLLIAGACEYFDAEGNLLPGVENMEQQLADGSKYNAAEYLASRVADYTDSRRTILFAVHNAYIPEMGGVARYIAREAGRPLIALLPPVKDPATTYADYQVIVCDK